ncbi:Clcn7 [Symbiodinium sp. CCMP2456]|nr:Clcn7 [Symbiodinium sp. CCMP2456]
MVFTEPAPGRSCLPSARCCFHPPRHVSTGPERESLTSTWHLRNTRISKVRCVRRNVSDNDPALGLLAEGGNARARGLGRLQGGRSKPGPRKPAVDIRRSQEDEGNSFGQVLSLLLALWLGRFVLEMNLFGTEGTYYVSSRSLVATTVTQGGRATTNIQENAEIRTNLWNPASPGPLRTMPFTVSFSP